MIRHFSKEDHLGQSTTGWLDSDDFPVRWFTASQTADFIASAPIGTQAASLDIEQAYHNSPITPCHKPFLAVSWNKSIYIGHVAIEGLMTTVAFKGTLLMHFLTSSNPVIFLMYSSGLTMSSYSDVCPHLSFLLVPSSSSTNMNWTQYLESHCPLVSLGIHYLPKAK